MLDQIRPTLSDRIVFFLFRHGKNLKAYKISKAATLISASKKDGKTSLVLKWRGSGTTFYWPTSFEEMEKLQYAVEAIEPRTAKLPHSSSD